MRYPKIRKIAFPSIEGAICLATTLRILEVKSNALGWTAARRIKDMAKSMEMVAKKSSYKWNLGTHLSFRLLRCNKNIAHLEINTNKLLISFVSLFIPPKISNEKMRLRCDWSITPAKMHFGPCPTSPALSEDVRKILLTPLLNLHHV